MVLSARKPKRPRVTTGYMANRHTAREKAWYCALADRVGHRKAPEYADDIIIWRQCRPPDETLEEWLREYDDGAVEIPDALRSRVESKVDRFHKQEHIGFLRGMMKAGRKAMEPVLESGDMKQPVILKYLADGVNQGMMLHSTRQQQSDAMQLGGLTINVGTRPPPRRLKQKEVDRIIDGEFKRLPEGDGGHSDSA